MADPRRLVRCLSAGALLAAALVASSAAPASAQFGVATLSNSLSSYQAGAHADLTTKATMSDEALGNPYGSLRNAAFTLPAGMVGNPLAIERCSIEEAETLSCGSGAQVGELRLTIVECPGVSATLASAVEAGATTVTVPNAKAFCTQGEPGNLITIGEGADAETDRISGTVGSETLELEHPLERAHAAGEVVTHTATYASASFPLFNVKPLPGHAAAFAATLLLFTLEFNVDVGADGRLTTTLANASTLVSAQAIELELWGVPGAPAHDSSRCNESGSKCDVENLNHNPFLSNPTNCSSTAFSEMTVVSWQGQSASTVSELPAFTGCEKLTMAPSVSVAPTTTRRDAPAGYQVDLRLPQSEDPNGLATPALEKMQVTLPAGASLSPAMANGLEACTEQQLLAAACPQASVVGRVEVSSPELPDALQGDLYVGAPTPTEEFRLFVRLNADGTVVLLRGTIDTEASNGRLSAVFTGLPQLPFAEMKLSFFGGSTAALANPPTCGPATSTVALSANDGEETELSSTFDVDEDSQGGSCPATTPFAPSFLAGTTDALAAQASPFTLAIERPEGQQYLSSFAMRLPAGLIGRIGTVPTCKEPEASLGACPQGSQVGTATIAVGSGATPLQLSGPVFLTGPYDDAPFGLAIAIDAHAGPYDLGEAVVRSRILVDPTSLALTIVSDRFPAELDGIPLRLRSLAIALNRPGFLLNPSSCEEQAITATIGSSEGATAAVSSPFRVSDCSTLKFAPALTASTSDQASRGGNGAELTMDITSPAGKSTALRTASIALPSQLRPRLTTLRHACLTAGSPGPPSLAQCPPQSKVGAATVSSPITAAPLTGSIYLIAHGGTSLPTLLLNLHGEGLEVDLEGGLSISSHDVIETTFKNLPDVPITSLELTMPRGPDSIFAAVAPLCRGPMQLHFAFVAQGGAKSSGLARVAVGGCSRRGASSRARRRRARRR